MAIINRHPTIKGQITLKTFDDIGKRIPLLIDLKPSWQIVRPLDNPLHPRSSLAVLYGNLAPKGAVLKASASKDKRLLEQRGRACAFKNSKDLSDRIDSEDLNVTVESVLVRIGPVGNPGMPEAGLIPIPRKLGRQGVTDMLRISDGRMSGTAGGTIVLHVSPESADPESVLGIVEDGDFISCSIADRTLHLDVDNEEIKRRLENRRKKAEGQRSRRYGAKTELHDPWKERETTRGYRGLYMRHVNQAEQGCDFDFLTADGPRGN